jgi:cytochrome c553
MNATYETKTPMPALPMAQASAAHGERLSYIEGCQDCHGPGLGGKLFLDIPPGRIIAPNLTSGRGGVAASYATDTDWDRAIRYGLRPDGKMLLPFMPYQLYHHLSDADAASLIAYIRSVPPRDSDLPATELRLPGYIMVGMPQSSPGRILERLAEERPPAPAPGVTPEYGRYLASVTCVECHGPELRGGEHPAPEAPPAPGLMHAAQWSLAEFTQALRTGVVPGGRQLSEFMPAKDAFSHYTDDEIAALHAYVKSLAAAVN